MQRLLSGSKEGELNFARISGQHLARDAITCPLVDSLRRLRSDKGRRH